MRGRTLDPSCPQERGQAGLVINKLFLYTGRSPFLELHPLGRSPFSWPHGPSFSLFNMFPSWSATPLVSACLVRFPLHAVPISSLPRWARKPSVNSEAFHDQHPHPHAMLFASFPRTAALNVPGVNCSPSSTAGRGCFVAGSIMPSSHPCSAAGHVRCVVLASPAAFPRISAPPAPTPSSSPPRMRRRARDHLATQLYFTTSQCPEPG